MARKGRGRLSGIEQLPEDCSPAVAWAAAELQKRERPQKEIYDEFVGKLESLGGYLPSADMVNADDVQRFKIPSFSAFNRYSVNLAIMTERINQTSAIASTLAENFNAQDSDDLTLIAAEAIKTLIFEILTSKGEAGLDPKGAMALANALRAASQAQTVSTARRQKVEENFAAKAKEAVSAVAKQRGMTAETADQILSEILGVKT
jgi:hypothetical protein